LKLDAACNFAFPAKRKDYIAPLALLSGGIAESSPSRGPRGMAIDAEVSKVVSTCEMLICKKVILR
jgi:hypothetical protein